MTTRTFSVFVKGLPVPQGSKNAFRRGNRCVLVDVNIEKLKAWREQVAEEVSACWTGPVLSGQAVGVRYAYRFPRPKYHFSDDGEILPRYRGVPYVKKPDGDKLDRAVNDALTGIVFKDDSQVNRWTGSKDFTDETHPEGVLIQVTYDTTTESA